MAELVIALDFDNAPAALNMARTLQNRVKWLKVGLELFCAAGPEIVAALRTSGFKVFLDLKFYDIPNTVAGAVRAAAQTGASMLTVHCQGGERMCRAAMEAAAQAQVPPLVIGVTALTSFANGEMPGIALEPGIFGIELAKMASEWGLNGVVCAGWEAAAIKSNAGILCVCPGIRPDATACSDQRRVMTPVQAVAAGADFLVIGRPVTRSDDPLASVEAVLSDMNGGRSPGRTQTG